MFLRIDCPNVTRTSILGLLGVAFAIQLWQFGPLVNPGFAGGVWHGITMAYVFIAELLFVNDLRIYTFPNQGVGYDFGYLLGGGLLGALLFIYF